jgi:mono/diheme cytochrome c family protein
MVAQAGKADPFDDLLKLADEKPAVRLTIVQGLSQSAAVKGGQKPKPLWLDGSSVALASLKVSLKSGEGAKAVTAIDERLLWVGKPGAPTPPKIVPLDAAQQAAFEKGRTIYASLCGGCHQPHGYGLEGLAPPLVDSEWVLGSPDVAARIVMHGLNGPVKVGGRTWDLAMPPMLQLTDADVAAVLTYVRREWEHTASPVSPAYVKDVRSKFSDRTAGWTADELRPPRRK